MKHLAVIDATMWETMANGAVAMLPRLGASVAVLLAFWIAGALTAAAIARMGRLRHVDPDIARLLAKSSKVTLLIFGAITALGTIGIDVSAIVAGLGLTSLALGLALKEVVSNAIAGVLILLDKPFKRGDVVAVLTFKGRVLEICLRYTTLDTPEGRVFVPNTLLLTNAVTVSTAEPASNTPSRGEQDP